MKASIKRRALLFLLVLPLLLIISLAAMLFFLQFNKDLQGARSRLEADSLAISGAIQLEIAKSFEMLRTVAVTPVVGRLISRMATVPTGLDNENYRGLEEFGLVREMLDHSARNSTVDLVYVASTGSSGLVLGRDVRLAQGFDVRGRDYYRAAMANPDRPVISEPRISAEQTAVPIIVITGARTVRSEAGEIVGIASFNYQLTPIIAIIQDLMSRFGVAISFYDTTGGYVLWHRFADRVYYFNPAERMPLGEMLAEYGVQGDEADALVEQLIRHNSLAFAGSNASGRLLLQSVKIPDSRWAILVSFPRSLIVNQVLASIAPPLLVFLLVFMVAQTAIYLVTRFGVIKPLVQISQSLEALASADADLTVSLPVSTNDEIGQLGTSFNNFVSKLRGLIGNVKTAVEDTNLVKQNVSASAEETSTAIEEISANLNAIKKQIDILDMHINENIQAINTITSNINLVDDQIGSQSAMVEQSTASITQMIASLNSVNSIAQNKKRTTQNLAAVSADGKSKIARTAETFKTVVTRIAEIQQMASSINSIAAQTNLLSMNAAIEAAHAGDSGRGFAVVAEEIRKLADSAGKSSKSIAQLIRDISAAIKETDQNVVHTTAAFENIGQEVDSTVNAFSEIEQSVSELNIGGQQILESTNQINDVTVHIRDGSREIKQGTRLLLDSSNEIKQVSDRVTTGMAESTMGISEIVRSMQDMVQMAQQLNQIVDDLRKQFGQLRTG